MAWIYSPASSQQGLMPYVTRWLQSLLIGPDGPLFENRILTNDLLYHNIFDHLSDSPAALLRLSRTCRTAHQAVHEYFSRVFNINKHLARFFGDIEHVLRFRSLQARTATLISGSQALQFFNRVRYDESDLDLYVPFKHRYEVGRWLLAQGYVFVPKASQDPVFEFTADAGHQTWTGQWKYRMKGVSAVYTFVKENPCATREDEEEGEGASGLKVQIIVARSSPMAAIFGFHSTVVLNLISWDRAYSLYPRATFTKRTAHFLCQREADTVGYTPYYADIVRKYTDRGFEFEFHLPRRSTRDPALTTLPRRMGDGHCWVLPLPQEGVTPPPAFNSLSRPLTRDPCCFSMWRLEGVEEEVVLEPRPAPAHLDAAAAAALWTARTSVGVPRVVRVKRPRVQCKDLEDRQGVLFYGYVKLADQAITLLAARQRKRRVRGGEVEVEYLDQYLVESCEDGLRREQMWYTWD